MKASLQPILENELILIRPLNKHDFESLYEVAKDPLIWEQHPASRYRKNEYSRFFTESLGSKGALIFIDKATGKMIGSSRYKPVKDVHSAVEIGWTFLARNYWGGKYNSMVKLLMMDYAFSFFEEIVFYVGKNNIRSQKAMEKTGANITSDTKYLSKIANNDIAYRVQKKDWNRIKSRLLKNTNFH